MQVAIDFNRTDIIRIAPSLLANADAMFDAYTQKHLYLFVSIKHERKDAVY